MVVISILIIILGSWLTFKVVQQQDFEHEEEKYKWVNYIFASVGMGWVVPTVFNLFTMFGGGVCIITTPHLLLGLLMVVVATITYHKCSYKGRLFCYKAHKIYKQFTS